MFLLFTLWLVAIVLAFWKPRWAPAAGLTTLAATAVWTVIA
jgi:hypothetical protein